MIKKILEDIDGGISRVVEEKEKVSESIRMLQSRHRECREGCAWAYKAYKEVLRIEDLNKAEDCSQKIAKEVPKLLQEA